MIIPVRCFSCGKASLLLLCSGPSACLYSNESLIQVVGDLWERYLRLLDEGVPDGYVCPLFFSSLPFLAVGAEWERC
jgi:DNA-directed RNA polymerase I, II, and III subunit RPABC5